MPKTPELSGVYGPLKPVDPTPILYIHSTRCDLISPPLPPPHL